MKICSELKAALEEETQKMDETTEFTSRFPKLIENYMDGMGSEAEIAGMIELITLTGAAYED